MNNKNNERQNENSSKCRQFKKYDWSVGRCVAEYKKAIKKNKAP